MTREDILEAAAQVFRQKGFHGASMNDIADAVHLRKASLYHHVSSKQEILGEILDQALQLLLERISSITNQNISPDKKLQLMIREYLTILVEKGHLTRRKVGKAFYYKAKTREQAALRSNLRQILNAYFDGSTKSLMLNLIRAEKLSEKDLIELKRLADEEEGMGQKGTGR